MADTISIMDKFLYKFYPKVLYKKTTYSQSGEDLLIGSCLHLLGVERPNYLDIGAHHPFYLNNTALLYEQGCTGINVEPNPTLFSYFKKFRKNDINLNVGVGVTQGQGTFYVVHPATLSTFSKEEVGEYLKHGYKIVREIQLEIDTVPNIITAHCAGKFPDVLSIDIEGLDHSILANLDLSMNYPKVICTETVKFDTRLDPNNSNAEMIRMLSDKGYSVFASTFVNTIFYKK